MHGFVELQDIGVIDTCADCGDRMDTGSWFWYAYPGGVHLTFHQDCKPDPGGYEVLERAMGVRLVDDRDGEEFVRLVALPDSWFESD